MFGIDARSIAEAAKEMILKRNAAVVRPVAAPAHSVLPRADEAGNEVIGAAAAKPETPIEEPAAPSAELDAPNAELGAPNAELGAPNAELGAPNAELGAPQEESEAPLVDSDEEATPGLGRLTGIFRSSGRKRNRFK